MDKYHAISGKVLISSRMLGHELVLTLIPSVLQQQPVNPTKLKHNTAFITKGVIGNDTINMYMFALMRLLSWTSDIEA
jgi:hypothetical protein